MADQGFELHISDKQVWDEQPQGGLFDLLDPQLFQGVYIGLVTEAGGELNVPGYSRVRRRFLRERRDTIRCEPVLFNVITEWPVIVAMSIHRSPTSSAMYSMVLNGNGIKLGAGDTLSLSDVRITLD